MAYNRLLSAEDILSTAVQMVEREEAEGISLRAVALQLGVKAPSLYRYFPHKGALELAVAEEALRRMRGELEPQAALPDPKARFIETANAYVRFAREHYSLYSFVLQSRLRETYGSNESKALWGLLLDAVSGVSGEPDDTAAAVAIWSFLHGYVTLEHAGAFGTSGPQGGLERGLYSFLSNSRRPPVSSQKRLQAKTAVRGRPKKQ